MRIAMLLTLFTLLLGARAARAQSTVIFSSTVQSVRVDFSGYGYVTFASAPAGNSSAPCVASGYGHVLAFDTNTSGGKAVYALVLAAKLSSGTVYAVGSGSCPIYGIVESWLWGEAR